MSRSVFESEDELLNNEETMKQTPSQSSKRPSQSNNYNNNGERRRSHSNNPSKSRSCSGRRTGGRRPTTPLKRKSGKMAGDGTSTKQQQNRSRRPRSKSMQESKRKQPSQQQQKQPQRRRKKSQHSEHSKSVPRSKSMPSLGTSKKIWVDNEELLRYPVSPMASVDSSWRHKKSSESGRRKQKPGPSASKNALKKKGADGQKRKERSKSCKPSLAGKDAASEDNNIEGDCGGALVLHEDEEDELKRREHANYNLEYSLGEEKVEKNMHLEKKQMTPAPKSQQPPQHDINKTPSDDYYDKDAANSLSGKETLDLSYTTGDEPWRGRMPAPVTSVGGTFDENATILSPGGTYDNETYANSRVGGTRPDPPTIAPTPPGFRTNPTAEPAARRRRSRRASSPDSYADNCETGIDDDRLDDRSSTGGGEQGNAELSVGDPATTTTSGDDSQEEGDDDGSLFDNAPSTTTNEKKSTNYCAPPLHSDVRSKKPTARTPSERGSKGSRFQRSPRKKKRGKKTKKITEIEIDARKHSQVGGYVEFMKLRQPKQQPNDDENSLDPNNHADHTDHISAITMSAALLRAPPPHSRVRAKKPQSSHTRNNSGVGNPPSSSPVPKSEEQKVAAASVAGPMTGNEIDVQSNCTNTVSEVTMPLALDPKFSKLLHSMMKEMSEQEFLESQPPGGGGDVLPFPVERTRPPPPRPTANASRPLPPARRPPPPPPPPPPPRHTAQQPQQRSAGAPARTAKQPPNNATALHESMTDLAASFFRNVRGEGLQQQQSTTIERLDENDVDSSLPLKPPRAGNVGSRGYQQRCRSPHSMKSSQSREMALQLSDAAAQLLSLQGGGGKVRPSPSSHAHASSNVVKSSIPRVENMPHLDEYHVMGLFTGEVNERGQPHGVGRMNYDNGAVFEGKWTNGV